MTQRGECLNACFCMSGRDTLEGGKPEIDYAKLFRKIILLERSLSRNIAI